MIFKRQAFPSYLECNRFWAPEFTFFLVPFTHCLKARCCYYCFNWDKQSQTIFFSKRRLGKNSAPIWQVLHELADVFNELDEFDLTISHAYICWCNLKLWLKLQNIYFMVFKFWAIVTEISELLFFFYWRYCWTSHHMLQIYLKSIFPVNT